jgi:outer membrane protein assembly factor BamB
MNQRNGESIAWLHWIGLALLAALLNGCATQDPAPPSQSPLSASWQIPFDGGCILVGIASSPVVNGGVIYLGSFDGGVYAFDAQTGEQRWRYETGKGLISGAWHAKSLEGALASLDMPKREVVATPVIHDDTVYIGSKDHKFYALDSRTGNLRWSFDTGGQIFFDAIVDGRQVLMTNGNGMMKGSRYGYILALDAVNGARRWMVDSVKVLNLSDQHRRGIQKPVLHNGTLYVTTSGIDNTSGNRISYLFAVDAKSGSLKWRFAVKESAPSEPIMAGDLVLFSALADKVARLYAVDVIKGEQTWVFETARKIDPGSSIHVGNRSAYFALQTTVVALNINTGQLRWRIDGDYEDKIEAEKVKLAERLLVSAKSELYGINLDTGKVSWVTKVGQYPQISSVMDGVVYTFSRASRPVLKAIDSNSGKERWTFSTASPIFNRKGEALCSGPVSSGGRLFFTTETVLDYIGQHPNQSSSRGRLHSIDAVSGK